MRRKDVIDRTKQAIYNQTLMKKKSLLQSLFLRVHYKTALAMIAVLLGIGTFSGFYFFGQNIVNEADERQRVARVQLDDTNDPFMSRNEEKRNTHVESEVNPEEEQGRNIGGVNTPEESTPTPATKSATTPTQTPALSPAASPSATPELTPTIPDKAVTLGEISASLTITAYLDFQGKASKKFILEILPQLQKEYIDTKKVKFVFRNFPLNDHTLAPLAHNAALCAAEQGKFWEYHNQLYTNQDQWLDKDKNEGRVKETLKSYGSQLGLASSFNSCVDSGKYSTKIEVDKKEGVINGVNGAPTFLIGTQKITLEDSSVDAMSAFRAVLDPMLKESVQMQQETEQLSS